MNNPNLYGHISVMSDEVIQHLAPQPGDSVLDVTLGLGGHASNMLQHILPGGFLVGLDADTKNLAVARDRLSPYGDAVTLIHANFSSLPACLPATHQKFDIIFADLGLSSPHVDDASRGFTFRTDAPLDMRYDQTTGMSAAQVLSQWDPMRIRTLFKTYGEIPRTGQLTDAIVAHRATGPIATSNALVSLVRQVYGHHAMDVLPQIFQALRIAVNDELAALEHFLSIAPSLLHPGGRLGILSYHSLEDTIVKRCFRHLCEVPKDPITGMETTLPLWKDVARKGVTPTETEIRNNPRSRSARLRTLLSISGVD